MVIVNGQPVFLSEYEDQLTAALQGLRLQNLPPEQERVESVQRQAVVRRNIIVEKLILREALRLEYQRPELAIKDSDVENRVNLERKDLGLESEREWQEFLDRLQTTAEEYRRLQRERLQLGRYQFLKGQELDKQVTVSRDEIEQYFEENKEKYVRPEQVHLRHIFLPYPPGATEQRKQSVFAQMEEILAEIQDGGNFAVFADRYSQGVAGSPGGDIGLHARGDLNEKLEEAAFSLGEGEVSDVIETDAGCHLIHVEEKLDARTQPVEEVTAEIEKILRKEKVDNLYLNWINGLWRNAYIYEPVPLEQQ